MKDRVVECLVEKILERAKIGGGEIYMLQMGRF